jgi:hypothetical protein
MPLGIFSTEAERREEFVRFLELEKNAIRKQFVGFLDLEKNAIRSQFITFMREEFVRFFELEQNAIRSQFISFLDSERKEEFVRFLGSEKALNAIRNQFISFLHSDEGKQLLVKLLIEVLGRGEIAPILNGAGKGLKDAAAEAETSLKNLAAKAGTSLKSLAAAKVARFSRDAAMTLEASAAAHSDGLKRMAREAADDNAERVKQDVRDHLSSYQAKVLEAVTEQILLQEEIPVRSRPRLSLRRANREIAREYGISIRQVKRRRRAALGLPKRKQRAVR